MKNNTHLRDTDNSTMIGRDKGSEGGRQGKGGINGDGRRLDFGWWAHNTIYR